MKISLQSRSHILMLPFVIVIIFLLAYSISFYRKIDWEIRHFAESAKNLMPAERCAILFERYINQYSFLVLTGDLHNLDAMNKVKRSAEEIIGDWEKHDGDQGVTEDITEIKNAFKEAENAVNRTIMLIKEGSKKEAERLFADKTKQYLENYSLKISALVDSRESVVAENLKHLDNTAEHFGFIFFIGVKNKIKSLYPEVMMTIMAQRFARHTNRQMKKDVDFIITGNKDEKYSRDTYMNETGMIIDKWRKFVEESGKYDEELCERQLDILPFIEKKYVIHKQMRDMVFALTDEGKRDEAVTYMINEFEPFNINISDTIGSHVVGEEEEVKEEIVFLSEGIKKAEIWITGTVVFIIIAVISVFYMVMKSLVFPIINLKKAAIQIGRGDFSSRAEINREDEIGELASAFNNMAVSLSEKIVSRDYVQSIIDSMAECLVVVSTRGNIMTVNPSLCSMLGYSEMELVGEKFRILFPEGNIPFSGEDSKDREKKWLILNEELSYLTKDGKSVPVLFSSAVMRDDEKNVLGVVCVAQDITKQKKNAEEREKLIAQLQDAIANVKSLSGMLPICASCKKIRDDKGYWSMVETYIAKHSQAVFTHSICPDCAEKLYGYRKK